jgi:hypothetical protein
MPAGIAPMALVATALFAAAAWYGLRSSRSKTLRQYPELAAAAILMIGVEYTFEVPIWIWLAYIFAAPFLIHRGVRAKLEADARSLAEVRVDHAGVKLSLAQDPTGKRAAVWRIEPAAGGARPESLPMAALEFLGEAEDVYQVVLSAPVAPFKPVALTIHHHDAAKLAAKLVQGPALDVPGAQEWMVVRGEPLDFALHLLDHDALALPRVILALRTLDRELVIQNDGGIARIISNKTFTKAELETLLEAFAAWHVRLCAALKTFQPRLL